MSDLIKRQIRFCKVCCLTILLLAIAGLLWTGYEGRLGKVGKWQRLAEITNSTGQCFVVAQRCQLMEGEGWRVVFKFLDSDKKLYGSLLELETIMPWRKVRLVQTNEMIEVWRGARLVGTLNLSTRVFRNGLNGVVDEYVEGFNGVQGQRMTNFLFDP